MRIKNTILGKNYDLSIAYISSQKSRELNKQYRQVDRPANVLSFPLSQTSGEILIAKEVARREGWSVKYLVIHGMLHLKGMRHGSRMEALEQKFLENDPQHLNRHRRGLPDHSGGGGRISKRRTSSENYRRGRGPDHGSAARLRH